MSSGPNYVLLGNGSVAADFLQAMIARGYPPAAVVLNVPTRQRDVEMIADACLRRGIPVVAWSKETRAKLVDAVADGATWLVSVYFAHILDRELLTAAGDRAVNLHAALLPWCRGVHTNVWPIVEGSPAGVTVHTMAAGLDCGPILFQMEVPVQPWDTAATLYEKLSTAGLELLCEKWPGEVVRVWPGTEQGDEGSSHRLADFAKLESFDMPDDGPVRDFYNLLRARSFPPYPGLKLRFAEATAEATIQLRWMNNEPDQDR